MSETTASSQNMFLTTPLGILFAKIAIPIIVIMFTNGLYTVVDGWFIGRFIGPEALSAVTMVFPLYMMLIALGTLVSSGFSSVVARYLGAGKTGLGEKSMVSAAVLSAIICVILILSYEIAGYELVATIAKGNETLTGYGHIYLSITINFSALFFLSALLSDALRVQGRVMFMSILSILSNILNMLFNYFLIVELDMGVAGTAYGTALAQICSISLALMYIYSQHGVLRFRVRKLSEVFLNWGEFLKLGAPISLTYIGVSILSAATIYQIQYWETGAYEVGVAAYGIVTRLLTFGYMPLLGMTLAQQAIVGNNFGAGNWQRAQDTLKLTLVLSFSYCLALQAVFIFFPAEIARIFVDSPAVIEETARILPIISYLYCLFGPLVMFPSFFQAVGDAGRAAILSLTKIYLISLSLILGLPHIMGEVGIWYASPLSEVLSLILAVIIIAPISLGSGRMNKYLASR